MAQSRLERIGTIFSRVTSLMKGGALKPENKPMWYAVYEAFPPKYEPRFDRPAPNIEVRDIFYKEDLIRARFHKDHEKLLLNNLLKNDKSQSLQFIEIYQELQNNGVPEADCYEKSLEEFRKRNPSFRIDAKDSASVQASQSEGIKIITPNIAELLKE